MAEPSSSRFSADLLLRVACTIGAASLLSILAAPLDLYWLHWVAYVPFFWVLREETPRANRWLAYVYGVVSVGLIFRWIVATIVLFSNIPTILAWGILLLFSAAFGLPYLLVWMAVHPLRKRLGDGWILALPAWLVVVEWLSMHIILFPYNQGITMYRFPPVWQLVSVTGVWGVSFLVMFFNCTLGEAIYRRREGRPFPVRWVALAVATLSTVIIWGQYRYDRVEQTLEKAPEITVGMIQTAESMTHRFSESRKKALFDWVRETESIIAHTHPGQIDLVVWSEGASPYNVHTGPVYQLISTLARKGDFEMLVGGGTVEGTHENGKRKVVAYNSVYLFGRDGSIEGRYDKVVPLPFGEYLPLAHVFPWLAELIRGPGDFRAGSTTNVLQGDTWRIASPICYEAVLPYLCRRFPKPDLLVNPTNDAWFGDTAAPHQHAMLATARAVELGIPLVRSGYTGVSMVVEPDGRIYAETKPFEAVDQLVKVRMGNIPTLYRRFGDWFVWLCALGLAAAWLIAPWRRGTPTALPVPGPRQNDLSRGGEETFVPASMLPPAVLLMCLPKEHASGKHTRGREWRPDGEEDPPADSVPARTGP